MYLITELTDENLQKEIKMRKKIFVEVPITTETFMNQTFILRSIYTIFNSSKIILLVEYKSQGKCL